MEEYAVNPGSCFISDNVVGELGYLEDRGLFAYQDSDYCILSDDARYAESLDNISGIGWDEEESDNVTLSIDSSTYHEGSTSAKLNNDSSTTQDLGITIIPASNVNSGLNVGNYEISVWVKTNVAGGKQVAVGATFADSITEEFYSILSDSVSVGTSWTELTFSDELPEDVDHIWVEILATDMAQNQALYYDDGYCIVGENIPDNWDTDTMNESSLVIIDDDNLLSANQTTVETDVSDFYSVGEASGINETLSRTTDTYYEGSGCAKLTSTYAGTQYIQLYFDQFYNLTPGNYHFEGWVKTDLPGDDHTLTIRMSYWDDESSYLTYDYEPFGLTYDTWTKIELDGIAPTGTAHILVHMQLNSVTVNKSLFYDSGLFYLDIIDNTIDGGEFKIMRLTYDPGE